MLCTHTCTQPPEALVCKQIPILYFTMYIQSKNKLLRIRALLGRLALSLCKQKKTHTDIHKKDIITQNHVGLSSVFLFFILPGSPLHIMSMHRRQAHTSDISLRKKGRPFWGRCAIKFNYQFVSCICTHTHYLLVYSCLSIWKKGRPLFMALANHKKEQLKRIPREEG